jgi:aarF domain-containing kinase
MASIDREDQDYMINAVIHLANKDYASLVDDFIKLNILPTDCDRAAIIPLMDKALTPYVKGGGAKKYEEELKKLYGMEEGNMSTQVGGFQAMTQDALTVLNDVPFSIPPYFAILGRAIVTLEGIALTGNEDYGIIMESYPFIARKLLAEGRPEIQQALQEVLFSVTDDDSSSGLKLNRLLALLNNASGAVGTQDGAAFVDLDQVPDDGLSLGDGFKLLLSDDALSLRKLLEDEVENIADVLFRQITRKGMTEAVVAFTPPRPPTLPFLGDVLPQPPKVQLDDVPFPFLLPSGEGGNVPSVSVMTPSEFTDLIAPKLSRDEEIYAISIADAAEEFVGVDAANFLRGDGIISTQTAQLVLAAATTGLLGNSNLLGTPAAKNTLKTLSDLLQRLDRNSSSEMSVEDNLVEATSKLNDVEKERLDEIVTELTQRILQRVRTRVSAKA